MRKILLLSLFVGAIQGCSSSSPSPSEVKAALKGGISECPNLSFENIKIINGEKIDELTHQVQVSFDLKVEPLSDDKIEEVAEQHAAYEAELKALSDKVDAADKAILDWLAQRKAVEGRIQQELSGSGLIFQSPEYFSVHEKLWEQYGGKDLDAKKESLELAQLTTRNETTTTKDTNVVEAWGGYTCIKKAGISSDPAEAVTKGAENSFEARFPMKKTDNGWIKLE